LAGNLDTSFKIGSDDLKFSDLTSEKQISGKPF
jgi:hypothetical protein